MAKASIPKGTRDFSPLEMSRRNYIFSAIREVFERYGYQPIETPAMELLETLTGKYGEEGDRLIFKILSRGEKLQNALEKGTSLSEEALRYDLTVPFARYVVQHQNDIGFPFKRYQIQPVWRADRPQKGRYREFYQCDVDVIGSDSLLNEVELVQIITEVFARLGINITLKLNHRKLLQGVAEVVGISEHFSDMCIAMDKLDKAGKEGVIKELGERGISNEKIAELQPFFTPISLSELKAALSVSDDGAKGSEEMQFIFDALSSIQHQVSTIKFDISLARGLDYYTGTIFEVVAENFPSAICAGGRYDNLTGVFGLPGISGVGVSFGADRIYDLMLEQGLFPAGTSAAPQVMFANFGAAEAAHCLKLLAKVRAAGISAELYPDAVKLQKQMKYADAKGISKAVLVGEQEMKSGKVTVKDMKTGEQQSMTVEELIHQLR